MSKPTALYRCFDAAGCLLYIGASSFAVRRAMNHAQKAAWATSIARIEFEWHADRGAAFCAEADAIDRERPLHNNGAAARHARQRAPGPSQGCLALHGWMKRTGASLRHVGTAIGVSSARIGDIAAGKAMPNADEAFALDLLTSGEAPREGWLCRAGEAA